MDAGFPFGAVEKAWHRQKRGCARCGQYFSHIHWGKNTDWFVHPIVPSEEKTDKTASNCVILCGEPFNNCHLKIGHGGEKDSKPRRISIDELPNFMGEKIEDTP